MIRGKETQPLKGTDPVTEFDEKHRFTSQLDVMRQDPTYQRFVDLGLVGASMLLSSLDKHNYNTWLVMAIDEIAGENVTGLYNSRSASEAEVTLEQMQRNVLAWGERESVIPISNSEERTRIGIHALTGLKDMFLPEPQIQRAMTEALFFYSGRDVYGRSITAELLLDGKPMLLDYNRSTRDGLGNLITEQITISGDGTPTLLHASASSIDSQNLPYHVSFRTNEGQYGTRAAARQIRDFTIEDHQIEVRNAHANIG